MPAEPILIVLVEDDDGHATLVERNLGRVGVANSIVRLKDGQEAIDFFTGPGHAVARVAAVDPALARHQDAASRRHRGPSPAQGRPADGFDSGDHADDDR